MPAPCDSLPAFFKRGARQRPERTEMHPVFPVSYYLNFGVF